MTVNSSKIRIRPRRMREINTTFQPTCKVTEYKRGERLMNAEAENATRK